MTVPRRRVERQLLESRSSEPATDVDREVGSPPVACPDDDRATCAQRREQSNRPLDVVARDVAEDPTHQQHVGRDGAHVGRARRRVSAHDLDTSWRVSRSGGRQLGVEFDEPADDGGSARMIGEDAEDVSSVSGADADHPDPTGGQPVERFTDVPLNDLQALPQRGVPVIVGVPGSPVHGLEAYSASQSASRASETPQGVNRRARHPS
jgi:hypothetical protein